MAAATRTGKEPSGSRKTFCYEDLKRRILTVELEPGALIEETRVSEAYGLSRPPFREVLRQLAGEGYVVLQQNRGATVTVITLQTFQGFFESAPLIYAAVARLAAKKAKNSQLARLKEAQRKFRDAIDSGNIAERSLSNQQFHSIIGEMAENEFLLPSLKRLLIDHTRLGMVFFGAREENAVADQRILTAADHHDRFIELIAARDADGVEELSKAHWELSRGEMTRFAVPESVKRLPKLTPDWSAPLRVDIYQAAF